MRAPQTPPNTTLPASFVRKGFRFGLSLSLSLPSPGEHTEQNDRSTDRYRQWIRKSSIQRDRVVLAVGDFRVTSRKFKQVVRKDFHWAEMRYLEIFRCQNHLRRWFGHLKISRFLVFAKWKTFQTTCFNSLSVTRKTETARTTHLVGSRIFWFHYR